MLSRRALRTFRGGVRYNSTAEPLKKKSIRLERFGNIEIPSAAEVKAKRKPPPPPPKPKSYEADLSYLQDAPSSSLSAKLMRMEQQTTPEEEAALAEKRQEDRIANIHAHLQKYRGVAENADLIRGEFDKSSAFLSAERPTSQRNEPMGNQRGPRRGGGYRDSQRGEDGRQARYGNQPRREEGERPRRDGQQNPRYDRDRPPPQRREDDTRVRADRQPRRLEGERPRRPQVENRQQTDRRKQTPSSNERRGRPVARTSNIERRPQPAKAQVEATEMSLDPDLADIDERIFEGTYKPTLTSAPVVASDPRSLFGTTSFAQKGAVIATQDGTQTVVASGTVDSFRGDRYDAYIKVTPQDFASPPDQIGPVKTALRTLAHQGHYSPPGTARTVGIITRITPKMAPAVPAP